MYPIRTLSKTTIFTEPANYYRQDETSTGHDESSRRHSALVAGRNQSRGPFIIHQSRVSLPPSLSPSCCANHATRIQCILIDALARRRPSDEREQEESRNRCGPYRRAVAVATPERLSQFRRLIKSEAVPVGRDTRARPTRVRWVGDAREAGYAARRVSRLLYDFQAGELWVISVGSGGK